MPFPTQLLDGYRHSVISVTDDQAKLLVFVGEDGVEGLAGDLARRCPAATLARVAPAHYTIEHSAFQGDLTCGPAPGSAMLEVRAPDLDVRKAVSKLPAVVGRYVLSETGSLCWGVVAGLGTLAVLRHFAPAFAGPRSARGASSRGIS